MKKLTAALLVFLMLVMTGTMALAAYTEGTYTATAQGNNGPVTVSVTFSADAITDVTVVEHSETAGLSDRPIAEIPAAIVENQSLAVDTVSGATNSSNAILTAVADCVAQAGGDVEALKAVAVEKAPVEDVEATYDVVVADTLEELAEKLGIPADTFVETIERYNSFVDAQKDDDFGKPLFGEKIDEAPFVATPRSPSLHHTMGGVKIDTNTHVISTEGNVIDGLYAAGEVTGGLHAGNRLGGNAMTDFLVFGRIAGENAAKAE